MEKFLDCGKLTFLTAEKIIGLIILKPLRHFESRTENLFTCLILWYIKSILYSVEDLSTNIKPLMRDSNKNLFILNQIYSQKL